MRDELNEALATSFSAGLATSLATGLAVCLAVCVVAWPCACQAMGHAEPPEQAEPAPVPDKAVLAFLADFSAPGVPGERDGGWIDPEALELFMGPEQGGQP